MIVLLVTPAEREIEATRAKKEQKFDNGIMDEVSIFTKGSAYWDSLMKRGSTQGVLNYGEIEVLKAVINYCNGIYAQLTKFQLKEVARIKEKLKEHMIE